MRAALRSTVRGVLQENRFGFARWVLLRSGATAADLRGCLWTGCLSLDDLADGAALRAHLVARHGGLGVSAVERFEEEYRNHVS